MRWAVDELLSVVLFTRSGSERPQISCSCEVIQLFGVVQPAVPIVQMVSGRLVGAPGKPNKNCGNRQCRLVQSLCQTLRSIRQPTGQGMHLHTWPAGRFAVKT